MQYSKLTILSDLPRRVSICIGDTITIVEREENIDGPAEYLPVKKKNPTDSTRPTGSTVETRPLGGQQKFKTGM